MKSNLVDEKFEFIVRSMLSAEITRLLSIVGMVSYSAPDGSWGISVDKSNLYISGGLMSDIGNDLEALGIAVVKRDSFSLTFKTCEALVELDIQLQSMLYSILIR